MCLETNELFNGRMQSCSIGEQVINILTLLFVSHGSFIFPSCQLHVLNIGNILWAPMYVLNPLFKQSVIWAYVRLRVRLGE